MSIFEDFAITGVNDEYVAFIVHTHARGEVKMLKSFLKFPEGIRIYGYSPLI
jgi:hypothetical protein